MEGFADKSLFFSGDSMDGSASMADPREAKYQLAERLVDNIRFGEAIRILEMLGDYGNSPALLEQAKALRAYQEVEETKIKSERKRQAQERAMREERDKKRRRVFYAVTAALCLIVLATLK